ncbi:Coq4 family protein [Chamaesiphon sp. VAR_48_metabat_135_sub]|jgi:ubiquinone biosynthesis protein COQ4|uniref:Coq4 family protein n=1 Tax=Chamaesiphon sp. VAR_48_metabat_135_sub TaxID=2964699 RepID=UPI00286C2421|nr:Coq4 family protein [Chamaesiphon sp. VAR_48_metabat_135_sub]
MKFHDLRRFNLDTLVVLKGALSLIRDPQQTDSVYDIEDGMKHSAAMAAATRQMMAQPEIAGLAAERYLAVAPDIPKLLQYPPDSLGYAYANYIHTAGFDPGFYRPMAVEDDTSYLLLRLRQTHDIWHVVTGFSTNVPGELGLKAFELAQTRRTMAGILIAGGFLKCLLQTPDELDELLDNISRGYRMGLQAQPLLAQKWEDNWDKSLSEWRSKLGITLVSEDALEEHRLLTSID